MLFGLLFAALTLAQAEEPPVAADVPTADPFAQPFADVLAEAREQYLGGYPDEARRLLLILQQRLLDGETPAKEDADEALIYLGEIAYNLGDYQGATTAFRQVLARDPNASINPYAHPDNVVGFFDGVRQTVARELEALVVPPPTTPRNPWTVWSVVPFGAPQFAAGKPARGLLYAGLQTTFAVTSLAMYGHLRNINGSVKNPRPFDPEDLATNRADIQRDRLAVQWPATAGFYLTWAVSVADGRSQPTMPVAAPIGTHGILLSWQF